MLNTIIAKIRNILGDSAKTTPPDIFTYVSSRVFTLSEPNVVSVDSVLVNDVEVDMSGNWTYSSSTNKVTFEDAYSLTADDVIEINFSYYNDYSDAELTDAIKYALIKLSINYGQFFVSGTNINPEPTISQQNLIALIAAILIKPDYRNIRMPDISLSTNEKFSKEEQISSIIVKFKQNPGKFTFLQTF